MPLTATPQLRGYHVEYTVGETNRCPGCAATSWFVGRFSAECGRCGTAVPIRHPHMGDRGLGDGWSAA